MVTIQIDIPKAMWQAAQCADAAHVPYNVCLACPFLSESCDGPNVLAMTTERWVEWATIRIKALGMTRQQLADKSSIPIATLHNIFAGKTTDMRHSTMRDLTKALIGDCWGQYPCHFAAMLMKGELIESHTADELAEAKAELQRMQARVRHLESTLEGIHKSYNEELTLVRNEEKAKVEFLKNQVEIKDKQNNALSERIRRQDAVIDKLTGG